MNITPSDAERFWSKVNRNGPELRPELGACWVWTAGLTEKGYGQFVFGKGGTPEFSKERAHRVGWIITNGPIAGGLYVLHRCDNRACVRAEHLFLGTAGDNYRDASAKGRLRLPTGAEHWTHRRPDLLARGGHGRTHMTAETVTALRRDWAAGVLTCAQLAKRYKITQSGVSSIVNRRTWKHIP